MSKQIELALLSLMPSWGSDLPPPLVALAQSLLAQSQYKASTLRAGEEIGRHYACANIACDRLKLALDLPPIQPHPPVPPRIYKRLYTHLDNVLPRQSATQTRGRKRGLAQDGPSADQTLPPRPKPTMDASLAPFKPTHKPKTASRPASPLHPWIRPVMRFLCAQTGMTRFFSTMLAGVESIMTPGGRMTQDSWIKQHACELVAAIFFYVVMRVRCLTTDDSLDRQGYVPLRKEILALMKQARSQVEIKDADETQAWRDWKCLKAKDFDGAVAHVKDQDWLSSDWYTAIADVAQGDEEDEVATEGSDEEPDVPATRRRADAMLQEQYEYISEARRQDFQKWKATMLSKIKVLQRGLAAAN